MKKSKQEIKKVAIKETLPEKLYVECKEANELDGKGYFARRKLAKMKKKNPDTLVLVKMEMNAGHFKEFYVAEKNEGFIMSEKQYIFDTSMKYYIKNRNIWAYDFHESLAIPLRKKMKFTEDIEAFLNYLELKSRKNQKVSVDANEIKQLIENSQIIDVENSLNPSTLKRFMDSEVIKQILQGAVIGKILKILLIISIIAGVLVLIDVLVGLQSAGVFEKLKGMFN